MKTEKWYARYSWIWFAALTGSVLPLALIIYVNPSAATDLWARFGYELPAAIAADGTAVEYVEFISHWATTGTIGFDLFGLFIAVTAFRRGERWAWLAFWYWPVLFITHFITYQSSFRYLQLVWLTISVAALLATYRRTWTSATAQSDAAPVR